jgi:formamidopyrimidine-DNA glycosylase
VQTVLFLRRFGKIWVLEDSANNAPLTKLAPDALLELPSLEAFTALMQQQRRSLKAVLLDQDRVLCGIGNWVADEVCTRWYVRSARVRM